MRDCGQRLTGLGSARFVTYGRLMTMKMRHDPVWALVGAVAALLATAMDVSAQRAPRSPTADPNEGTVQTQKQDKQFPLGWAWSGVSLNGKPFPSERPTLTVDENLRGSGFSGCNTFSATMYPLKDQSFAVGPIAVTRRSCDKAVSDSERALLLALRTAQRWDTVGGRLVIKTQAGEIIFERAL